MTSRRRWLRPSITSHSNSRCTREYECLEGDSPPRHFSLTKARRSVVVTKSSPSPTNAMWKSRTQLGMVDQPTALLNDQPNSNYTCCTSSTDFDGSSSMNTPRCWRGVRVDTENRIWGKETDDEEEDDMFHFTKPFTEKYYASSSHLIQSHDLEPIKVSSNSRSKCKQVLLDREVGLSQSFETQETQLEESSETSLCTTDDEIDRSSKSTLATLSANETKIRKRVQWPDEQPGGSIITKVHSLEYVSEIPYTCRVVILLLMDRGAQSEASNFEFLHCEFRQDDRLRVCDALPQITQLVLGSAQSVDSSTQAEESFRPFTRLYLDGRELINSLALQDYCLEDGQSTLVALREPLLSYSSKNDINKFTDKQRRDALLRQSELLLADKRLRRGIRKARIAGRSLQVLYGAQGMVEHKERLARAREIATEENVELEEPDIADSPDEHWPVFDTLARTSFDSDDLKDISSFDLDFFEGSNFFRHSPDQNYELECFFESSHVPWPVGEEFVGAINCDHDYRKYDVVNVQLPVL